MITKVSGDGKLAQMQDTSLDLLEIYLVSSDTKTNFTVTQGTQFLSAETGSVRHLNWDVPTCIAPGNYNVRSFH